MQIKQRLLFVVSVLRRGASSPALFWTLALLCIFYDVVSLGIGVHHAVAPRGSVDLMPNYLAFRNWESGLSPYQYGDFAFLFPAVFVVAPFSWSPFDFCKIAWAMANLAFLFIIIASSTAFFLKNTFWQSRLVFAIVILSWSSVRVTIGNGQFGLFSIAFILIALVADQKRMPILGGLALCLALSKWTITFPFLFYFLLRRRWALLVSAMCCLSVCLIIFSSHLGLSPFEVLQQYIDVLSVQAKVKKAWSFTTDAGALGFLFFGTSGILAASILCSAFFLRGCVFVERHSSQDMWHWFLAICSLYSLIVLPHLSYDQVLLIFPLSYLFSKNLSVPRSSGIALIFFISFFQWFDLPGALWKLLGRPEIAPDTFLWTVFFWFDRLWLLVLFTIILALGIKNMRTTIISRAEEVLCDLDVR